MKNRKVKIEINSFVYCVLSFVGLVNFFIWIRMADKMRMKRLKNAGILTCILCIALMIAGSVIAVKSEIISEIFFAICAFLIFVPIFVICRFRKEYVRRLTLITEVKEKNINVGRLDVHEYAEISLSAVPELAESSRKLYGEKGEAVLRAIKLYEIEQEKIKVQVKLEAEQKKIREEEEKARLKREEIEMEREKARAEAERLKIEKAKAEAEMEREKAKAEAERLKIERAKVEAEKAKAETERSKLEAEKTKQVVKSEINHINEKNEEKYAEPVTHKTSDSSGIKKTDINLCSEQELSIVPGIGIILAKKAISIRNEKGKFKSVDEFIDIIGIRAANIELAKPYLECRETKKDSKELKKRQGRKIDL